MARYRPRRRHRTNMTLLWLQISVLSLILALVLFMRSRVGTTTARLLGFFGPPQDIHVAPTKQNGTTKGAAGSTDGATTTGAGGGAP